MTREAIAAKTLELLSKRGADSSICPSEVVRQLSPQSWRERMPLVREVAAELMAEGKLRVTQGDQEVNSLTVKGAIRLRLP